MRVRHDSDDLQKRSMRTCFHFEQNVIDAAIDQWWERLRSCVRAADRHFEHMLWIECHLYDSSEHFMKLSMQFDACRLTAIHS